MHALGLVMLARRGLVGDNAFVAVLLVSVALGTNCVARFQAGGSGVAWELMMLGLALVAVVFCERRFLAALSALAVVVGVGICAWVRLIDEGVAVSGVIVEAFTCVSVLGVVRMLRELAHRAIDQAQRGEMTDPLTGLANRRGLERLGTPAWERRAHARSPMSVLIIDIDHFKDVNDTRGHAEGDVLIRQVGELLRELVRPDDLVVRLGGEEFGVLAQLPPGQAQALGERLREAVETRLAPITVSVGAMEVLPAPADEMPTAIWAAIDVADGALYEAKRSGRNRVVSAGTVAA